MSLPVLERTQEKSAEPDARSLSHPGTVSHFLTPSLGPFVAAAHGSAAAPQQDEVTYPEDLCPEVEL